MSARGLVVAFAVLGIAVAGGLLGCGGGDDDGDTVTATVTNAVTADTDAARDVAGTWNGTITSGGTFAMQLRLAQAGDALTGSFDGGGENGPVSGSINDDNVTLTSALDSTPGTVIEFKGSLNDAGNQLSGTWKTTAGVAANGDWTVTQ